MYQILLVEDAAEFTQVVRATLGAQFDLTCAASLRDARHALEHQSFDLILLDLTLPDGSGFDFFAELKGSPGRAPVVILSGRGEVQDRVTGWTLGADDYIVKPFSPREFRVRIVSRIEKHRATRANGDSLRWANVSLNAAYQEATVSREGTDHRLELTPIEFKLFYSLARQPERALTRTQLIEAAWGQTVHITERTVDKHISTLRRKLEPVHVKIKTVSGLGYRLDRAA